MFSGSLDEEDDIVRCEIDFVKGIRVSFDTIPEIDTIHYFFDEEMINDFSHNLNFFWNNIQFYNCFEKIIKQAMEQYDEYIHKTGGSHGRNRAPRQNSNSNTSNNNSNNNSNRNNNRNSNSRQNSGGSGNGNNGDRKEQDNRDDNNGDDNDDNDQEKKSTNDNDKPDNKNKNEKYNMSEIMNLRGVCHCSGDCGNTLIKSSILFCKSILNGNLLLELIDERKHLQLCPETFWPHLFKGCFDNNKQDYLADIMCFVEQMWKTVPVLGKCLGIEDLISRDRWLDEKNENNWQEILVSIIDKSKQKQRIRKIHHWVNIMFSDIFSKLMPEQCQHNGNQAYYFLNRCFRAIIIHNYRNGCDMSNDLSKRKMPLVIRTSLKMMLNANNSNNKPNNISDESSLSDILHSEAWNKFDKQAIEEMSGHKIRDFTAMRLIILTMNFFNECHCTFDFNLKCIDIKKIENKANRGAFPMDGFDFVYEMIKHGFLNKVTQTQQPVDQLYESERNKSMICGNQLTKSQLTAIRLWTNKKINETVKKYHFDGNSCEFRELCFELKRGIKKLKYYDSQFDISKYKKHCFDNNRPCVLYTPIRNVFLNPQQEDTKMKILSQKQAEKSIDGSVEEYCCMYDTFTSTSTNFKIAFGAFEPMPNWSKNDDNKSNSNLNNNSNGSGRGMILQIYNENLFKETQLLFGDISWISEFPGENEILFAPCMLDIYPINYPKHLASYSKQISNKAVANKRQIVIAGAEMVAMRNIGVIMNDLKEKLRYKGSFVNVDTIPSQAIGGGKQLTRIETNIKQSIFNAFSDLYPNHQERKQNAQRCFDILMKNQCLNKRIIGGITENDLKSLGIDKFGERAVLFQELKNIKWDHHKNDSSIKP